VLIVIKKIITVETSVNPLFVSIALSIRKY